VLLLTRAHANVAVQVIRYAGHPARFCRDDVHRMLAEDSRVFRPRTNPKALGQGRTACVRPVTFRAEVLASSEIPSHGGPGQRATIRSGEPALVLM
jgi:hypothetical protein